MYVYLEDAWHYLDDNEHTTCGIVVPPNGTWERAVPEGQTLHCGPGVQMVEPKAKKKG